MIRLNATGIDIGYDETAARQGSSMETSTEAMEGMESRSPPTWDRSAEPPLPRAGVLVAAVAMAAAHALWALFQWTQLVLARRGGDYFCGLGESVQCAAVWDTPLASAIHRATGLPVAGWGLAWSMAAFALPLWALARRVHARSPEPVWSATLLTALAGTAAIVVLAAASVASGLVCTTCVVTYAMVLAYAATCLRGVGRLRSAEVQRGAVLALSAVLVAFLALLYPGLRTPSSSAAAGSGPLELAVEPGSADLGQRISRLSPQLRQFLSNSLAAYANSEPVPPHPARSLSGPPAAAVRITVFSDILCVHCARLHRTLTKLREALPRQSFALELRQFPLDSACNPVLEWSSGNPVHCLAARALICVDDRQTAFADALFENQQRLTPEKVYELAAPFMPRARLAACVASPETEAKLQDDIAWAKEHDIVGTPLVLVNGREALASVDFLYLLVLTQADPQHPAFAALPPGNPEALLR